MSVAMLVGMRALYAAAPAPQVDAARPAALRVTSGPVAVMTGISPKNTDQRISGTVFTLEGYMDRLIAQRRIMMTFRVMLRIPLATLM